MKKFNSSKVKKNVRKLVIACTVLSLSVIGMGGAYIIGHLKGLAMYL